MPTLVLYLVYFSFEDGYLHNLTSNLMEHTKAPQTILQAIPHYTTTEAIRAVIGWVQRETGHS